MTHGFKRVVRGGFRVLAAAPLFWAWAGAVGAGELAGQLVSASGPVEVRPVGERVWRAATLRVVLHPGDMVRTGPGGAAEVTLTQGVFRMDENTVIILPPPRPASPGQGEVTGARILLYRGRALFHLLKERLQGPFDVITPSVIVGVKGTTFGVEQGRHAGVVVFDGSVQVVPTGRPDATPVTVTAGQFTLLVGGQFSPPQPYTPGVPGALWSRAPTSAEGTPLPSPPPGLPPSGAPAPVVTPAAGIGLSPPGLSQMGGPAGLGAGSLLRLDPPRLAAVGGPPGNSASGGTATGSGGTGPVAFGSIPPGLAKKDGIPPGQQKK